MMLGAVGTGKTSASMYPYVDQLVRSRAGDQHRKVGGFVLVVKGDVCRQLQQMLRAAGRDPDYLEVSASTPVSATTRCTTILARTSSPTRSGVS